MNELLEKTFLLILNMSFTASFVIVVVLLLRILLKKAPKLFSYSLWSVVLFRLACPFSFESIISLLPTKANPIPTEIAYMPAPKIDTGIAMIDNAVSAVLPPATEFSSINPMQVLIIFGSIIWAVGVISLLLYSIISINVFSARIKGKLHLRDNIFICENIGTAFVLGVFRPKIYLPSGLSDEQQKYIILHEQNHIKRGDHIVKLISFLVLCFHWFNPLAWIAFHFSSKDMEMSCDESVIKRLGNQVKKDYSSSLLTLATGKRRFSATPLAFGEGDTRGRVKNVLNYKKPAFWVIVVAVILVVAVIIGFMANPKQQENKGGFAGVNAVILSIDKDNETMTVKGVDEPTAIGDKCELTWEKDALRTVATNQDITLLTLDDYAVGDSVVLFIDEIQESYPTRTKARAIQLQPKNYEGTDYNLWKARTKYIGDNVAVGKVISGIGFPLELKYESFALQTGNPPYKLTIALQTDDTSSEAFSKNPKDNLLRKKAIVLFSLIENLGTVNFEMHSEKSTTAIMYARDEIEKTFDNLYERSETGEAFAALLNDISEKYSESAVAYKDDTTATPTTIPLSELPAEYPFETATANGDYVELSGKTYNDDIMDKFISAVEQKKPASVRVVKYTFEGDPIIIDYSYDANSFNVTFDGTRDEFGSKQMRSAEYKYMTYIPDDKNDIAYYFLSNSEVTAPLETALGVDGSILKSVSTKKAQ